MAQQWYVQISGQARGPLTPRDLRKLALRGDLEPETPVSMDRQRWYRASQLKGLEFQETVTSPKTAIQTDVVPEPTHELPMGKPEWDTDFEAKAMDISSLTEELEKPGPLPGHDDEDDPIDADIQAMFARPTEMLPGYEIVDVLGRGGMGVVYRAMQTNLQRDVAIKTLLVNLLSNPKAITRFEREAVTIAKLRHPNIVTAHDFGRADGRLYLVMELLEGENLEFVLHKQKRFDELMAWGLARQTASALAHASQAGIVHRDIKPANLFLVDPPIGMEFAGGSKLVKVTDFGIALLERAEFSEDRLTGEHVTVGTPRYMAPEQCFGGQVTHRADIYSLGATIYHMLAGFAPFANRFDGSDISRMLIYRSSNKPDSLLPRFPDVSAGSDDLLQAMLEPDPDRRLGSYEELIERIDQIFGSNSSLGVSPPSTVSRSAFDEPKPASTEIHSAATQTTPVPEPHSVELTTTKSRSKFSWAAIGLSVLAASLVLGIFVWQASFASTPEELVIDRPPPDLISIDGEALFNGQESGLAKWAHLEGASPRLSDDDSLPVLEINNGKAVRLLQPYDDYEIRFEVMLEEADTVEIEFAIEKANSPDATGKHYLLHIDREEIFVGARTANSPDTEVISNTLDFKKVVSESPGEPYIEVHLLRYQNRWWAIFPNERSQPRWLGAFLEQPLGELNEIRIFADDSAYFTGMFQAYFEE